MKLHEYSRSEFHRPLLDEGCCWAFGPATLWLANFRMFLWGAADKSKATVCASLRSLMQLIAAWRGKSFFKDAQKLSQRKET
jgi:hypothetical protein